MTRGRVGRAAILGLLLAGCVSAAKVADIAPGDRPAEQSDEAGLWLVMERAEANLRSSGRVVEDPALNAYLRSVACKVAPELCADIRIYLVEVPEFNASMAPNGFMSVWTGLMLRCRNEAQLAYILGHEIGHYQRRHTVKQWRAAKDTSNFMLFANIVLAGAGVGVAGYAVDLAAVGGFMAYGRDHEREADAIGFERMVQAGYDPDEAVALWQALIEESEAGEENQPFFFFATHPGMQERVKNLGALAAIAAATEGATNEDAYLAATLPFRGKWLRDELRRRNFGRTEVVLDHLDHAGRNRGEIAYYRGELYRLRGEDGDERKAVEAYQAALAQPDGPAEARRGLGEVYRRMGKPEEARAAFTEYLRLAPDAPDRAMIEAWLASPS
ncbi:MAG TPA: M48 family metalloprotease [Alphaproteobacteria bacterium]|nr:M48 family metalloprotease [Alphaproteobacteria bacterium]